MELFLAMGNCLTLPNLILNRKTLMHRQMRTATQVIHLSVFKIQDRHTYNGGDIERTSN